MAMERLIQALRQQGNDRDNAIADSIDGLLRLRGTDISIAEFVGHSLESHSHPKEVHVFEVIAASIRNEIFSGKYPVGSKLPHRNVLARRYNTSEASIGNALRLLQDEGIVNRRQKSGTIVVKAGPQV